MAIPGNIWDCPQGVTCPGTDYPVSNFSSEEPDWIWSLGISWPGQAPTPMNRWSTDGCLGICWSDESQAIADLCAYNQSITNECITEEPPPPAPPNPASPKSGFFINDEQTCAVNCPDGKSFSYTIRAGAVVSSTHEQANRIAYSIACKQAAANMICMTPPTQGKFHMVGDAGWICAGTTVNADQFIMMSGPGSPFSINVSGGSMPPGMQLVQIGSNEAVLDGTPTVPGSYQFSVTANNGLGASTTQTFTMDVLGISNGVSTDEQGRVFLPGGAACEDYSFQLQCGGCTAPVAWSWNPEIAPNWLTITPGGLISGQPDQGDAGERFDFAVTMTDAEGRSCEQTCIIDVAPFDCGNVSNPASAEIEIAYSYQIPNPAWGTAPYAFAVTDPSDLPNNIGMNGTGLMTGTPDTIGTYPFGLRITDTNGCMCEYALQIIVLPHGNAPTSVTCPTDPNITSGTPAYTYTSLGGPNGYDQFALDAMAQNNATNNLAGLGCANCDMVVHANLRYNPGKGPDDPTDNWVSTTCNQTVYFSGAGFNPFNPFGINGMFNIWGYYWGAFGGAPFGTIKMWSGPGMSGQLLGIFIFS